MPSGETQSQSGCDDPRRRHRSDVAGRGVPGMGPSEPAPDDLADVVHAINVVDGRRLHALPFPLAARQVDHRVELDGTAVAHGLLGWRSIPAHLPRRTSDADRAEAQNWFVPLEYWGRGAHHDGLV